MFVYFYKMACLTLNDKGQPTYEEVDNASRSQLQSWVKQYRSSAAEMKANAKSDDMRWWLVEKLGLRDEVHVARYKPEEDYSDDADDADDLPTDSEIRSADRPQLSEWVLEFRSSTKEMKANAKNEEMKRWLVKKLARLRPAPKNKPTRKKVSSRAEGQSTPRGPIISNTAEGHVTPRERPQLGEAKVPEEEIPIYEEEIAIYEEGDADDFSADNIQVFFFFLMFIIMSKKFMPLSFSFIYGVLCTRVCVQQM